MGSPLLWRINIDSVSITDRRRCFILAGGRNIGEISGVCNLMLIQVAKLFSLKSDNLVLSQSHQSSYVFFSAIDQQGNRFTCVVDSIRSDFVGYGNRTAFSILGSFLHLETHVGGKMIGNTLLYFNIDTILHSNIHV